MQPVLHVFQATGTAKQAQKQMQEFVEAHLELVTVLGSRAGDPNALAGGLAALVKSMPGGERRAGPNAMALSNYFGKIVTTSPSLSGQDIANAAGRLAQVKILSGMSMTQLLAGLRPGSKGRWFLLGDDQRHDAATWHFVDAPNEETVAPGLSGGRIAN